MLQECAARKVNARVDATMFEAETASLKVVDEDLRKQLKAAQVDATNGNR
jgi:hypothetical protein